MAAWIGSGSVVAAATGWTMYQEVTTVGHQVTGRDFWNNTWRAVRGLLNGAEIYGPAHVSVPGIGAGWPVSPHVPGSLLWQAPFALLPLRAAVLTYAAVSIAAIWAGVFLLTRPRTPPAVLAAACCGGFAICIAGGPMTLRLGQVTAFTLLGLAMVVRARRPWLAGLGFMLAAATIQTALPLALALLVLGGWPAVWRGATLVLATSVPPVALTIASQGLHGYSWFVSEAAAQVGQLFMRIDLGSLLLRLGVTSLAVQAGAGLLAAALTLVFLARLPPHLRRIDYPPVLCLVIAFTLLCTYHETYDMLLVGGLVTPVILVNDQSRAMLPAFALAGVSAALSGYNYGFVFAPIALLGIASLSARAALQSPGPEDGSGGPSPAPAVHEPLQPADGTLPC